MKPVSRLSHGLAVLCVLSLLTVFPACDDPDLTNPEATILLARAEKPVEVEATDPSEAPQDTTLDVFIFGEEFDAGSEAEFLLDGVPTGKVNVKKTHYINKGTLRAEVEVLLDAPLHLYDVAVTTSRGKRGIGTELFQVIEKTTGPAEEFAVTDFQVIEVDHAEAPARCPDPSNPCYKLVLLHAGKIDSLAFRVSHVYGEQYFDPTLQNTRLAIGATLPGATDYVVPDVPGVVTAYWQGQWRPVYWETPMGPSHVQPEETLVDFAPVGVPDMFTFGYDVFTKNGGRMGAYLLERFPQAYALYRGQDPKGSSYAVIDDFELAGRVHPKFPTTSVRFHVHAFSSLTDFTASTTVYAYHRVMVTYPDRTRSMLVHTGGGIDAADSTYRSTYALDSPVAGCYEVAVVGMDGFDGTAEHFGDRFIVWDPALDPAGAAPLGVVYDGATVTTQPGGCGY